MDNKTILCFGDSNTWGYDPVNQCRFSRNLRWPGVMHAELGGRFDVIEEGLCGRTTVWDDPVEGHPSGLAQLIPTLQTHCPLDLMIIMLGTNDMKNRYSVSAMDITWSIARLIETIRNCPMPYPTPPPQILIISPASFGDISKSPFSDIFIEGDKKSRQLAPLLKELCTQENIEFLDADKVITLTDTDGIHLEQPQHKDLGIAVAQKVKSILK